MLQDPRRVFTIVVSGFIVLTAIVIQHFRMGVIQ